MDINYQHKYLKYKSKYLALKGGVMVGGANLDLYNAVKAGNLNEVNRLITEGVDVNYSEQLDGKPLHHAASSGNIPIAKALIDHKADINIFATNVWRNFSDTPLDRAIIGKHVDMVQLLVDNGAIINNDKLREANKEYVESSPQHEPLESFHSMPHLIRAVNSNNIDIVKLLVNKKDTDVNVKYNDMGSTYVSPLQIAINKNSRDIMQLLIDKGADISLTSPIKNEDDELLKWLINKGADVNKLELPKSRTYLHLAAQTGNTDVIKILIENGADPNVKDADGKTPMDEAKDDATKKVLAEYGSQLNCVKFLELYKAMKDIPNFDINVIYKTLNTTKVKMLEDCKVYKNPIEAQNVKDQAILKRLTEGTPKQGV